MRAFLDISREKRDGRGLKPGPPDPEFEVLTTTATHASNSKIKIDKFTLITLGSIYKTDAVGAEKTPHNLYIMRWVKNPN